MTVIKAMTVNLKTCVEQRPSKTKKRKVTTSDQKVSYVNEIYDKKHVQSTLMSIS